MFICIQISKLYFLTNYKLPIKFPNTRKLRDDLNPPSRVIGEETGTQNAESVSIKATQLIWQI